MQFLKKIGQNLPFPIILFILHYSRDLYLKKEFFETTHLLVVLLSSFWLDQILPTKYVSSQIFFQIIGIEEIVPWSRSAWCYIVTTQDANAFFCRVDCFKTLAFQWTGNPQSQRVNNLACCLSLFWKLMSFSSKQGTGNIYCDILSLHPWILRKSIRINDWVY